MNSLKSAAAAMREQITARLRHPVLVHWQEQTTSTNDDARRAALDGAAAPAVFGAEQQSAGRGRLRRHWETGSGEAVEMSFLLRPQTPAAVLAGYNFAAALGICAGLETCCGVQAQVKWPNDVVVGGRKICGILSEASLLGGEAAFVVTGTGVNVNQRSFPEGLGGAVSLRMLTGTVKSRADVAAACIEAVLDRAGRFEQLGFAGIMDEYRERSAVLGRDVDVVQADGTVPGRCVDFDPDGAIVVDTGGRLVRFHANDVSLRGAGLHV